MSTLIRVSPDSTRDDLIVCVGHLNDRARRTLRYDPQGRENPAWRDLHETINDLLDQIARMP